ncbi:U6 snrna-associated sm-like protein [Penicillium bovifimosum]|uniref:LSM2-LSM8 complex subunit LSM8 n=1 Tax=Penicillium bovifimosum TaxID=126998 RepID=A0A9W9H0F3_9EURO|nr:U6 snrna-associated sm-like protein [Penicillium bovifimosum]KAJ5135324.1 U6 snrna-associated sm-like protein [Penicillium bovifimosum]
MSLHEYINSESPVADALIYTSFHTGRVLTKSSRIEKVLILTVDGRTLIGDLLSTDQMTNLVLSDTVERIIRTPDDDEPSTEIQHGLYLIRGDNVVICGEIDQKMDADIDWSKVKGEVIGDTKNA